MERIKGALSHAQGKESDVAQGRYDTPTTAEFDRSTTGGLTGEGSHLASAHQSASGVSGEYHPIYDQFTKDHASGAPINTTNNAPHFSNTPNVLQSTSSSVHASAVPSATSSLHTNQYRPAPHEDMSTASIKSGVIGFPQGSNDTHAALSNNNPFEQKQHEGAQPAAGEDLLGTRTGEQRSHIGQDAAVGAGALGAGALPEQGARGQPEDTSYNSAGPTPQINLQRQESDVPESGRSFPLAGGVTHRAPQTTSEREPGTKEKEARLHDVQDREALAGAAAAAAAFSVIPQNDGRTEATLQSQTSQSTNPEALAAARTAASTSIDEHDWSHDHGGRGHKYEGDPCETAQTKSPQDPNNDLLFTSGPHATDTANRVDPKLHIPGEYPSPTPLEESNAPSYLQSKPTTTTNPSAFGEPGLRHTGSLNEPLSRTIDQPTSESHYGRDAAIAGGLGAAGVGAYEVGKHHKKESTDISNETFPSEPNPYTSNKVDPRVDSVPRGGFAEQRYDPAASENRTQHNAALTGGAIESSQPSTKDLPKEHELDNKEYPAAGQDAKSDSQHHYGRNAALVGAGAATTAGLYASQREAEPSSGPASSTIGPHTSNAANILDPRVQPNPDLQKHHYAAPTVEDPAPSTVGPHKSDLANIIDPRVFPDPQKQKAAPREGEPNQLDTHVPEKESQEQPHHYGRDAAIAGGVGAASYGAYEAAKSYAEHPSTQLSASMNKQRYDPTASGAHNPRVAGTTPNYTAPQDQQHRYGRDAAVVGGAGALGAGAYAATREHNQAQQPSVAQPSQQPPVTQEYNQPSARTHQRYDSTQIPEQDHTKRNAALGTAAAAGAGAGGAYAYSQYDAQKDHERQLKEQQKAFDDQQKSLEKQQAKDQKQHDKLVAAEEKKHQKEAEHKEREHAKELDNQQKEHDKLAAIRAKGTERERTPEEEEGSPKEKKHRFLTFLNKKDKDKNSSGESSPRQSRDSPRHSKEYAAGAGAVGLAGSAEAYEHEHEDGRHLGEKHGRSVLHKDPPKGHPAREALENTGFVGKREHIGTDGPIGDPSLISGDRQTRSGVYGAHPIEDVMEGGHHTVTEPHTGLPMNVERYGDGHGGTDGSNTIHGQHEVLGQGAGTTDWEAIRKGDTVY